MPLLCYKLRGFSFQQDPYIASMEHHTDWVNDVVLCCNGKTCEYLRLWVMCARLCVRARIGLDACGDQRLPSAVFSHAATPQCLRQGLWLIESSLIARLGNSGAPGSAALHCYPSPVSKSYIVGLQAFVFMWVLVTPDAYPRDPHLGSRAPALQDCFIEAQHTCRKVHTHWSHSKM